MQTIVANETSLLVVDVQKGFTELCPDELPVPGGTTIVPQINHLLSKPWKRIDASLDWHPPDHCSFLGQKDNLYPAHCVMGTPGVEFVPGVETDKLRVIWRKGYQHDFEAYAVTAQHPGMIDLYRAEGIITVVICGIATNICCFYAARDFQTAGFRVVLVEDASAGIDVPEAGLLQETAKQEGLSLGIEYVLTEDVVKNLRS
ncbi:MAG: isochorismatase family protein [Gemmataceae bacterium]